MESFIKVLIFLWDKLIKLLYPNQCMVCGKLNEDGICVKCYKKLETNIRIDKYKDKNFNEHLYIFKYEGKIRNLIIDYKFNDKAYLYNFFTKIILKNKKVCRKIKKPDQRRANLAEKL